MNEPKYTVLLLFDLNFEKFFFYFHVFAMCKCLFISSTIFILFYLFRH